MAGVTGPGRAGVGSASEQPAAERQGAPATQSEAISIDVEAIKADFPILDQKVNGHRAVYLDSAASSQKPTAVLAAMTEYYETTHANVHRGVYAWAEEATARYEASRTKVRRFIGAGSDREPRPAGLAGVQPRGCSDDDVPRRSADEARRPEL